jgi:hypothetical protein
MNPMLKKLLAIYMAPAGDDGSDTGGTAVAEPEAATPEDRGDVVDPGVSTEALQALVASDKGEGEGGAGTPAAAPAAPNPDEDGAGQGERIPKARFNEVNEQRKAALARNSELEAELERLRSGQASAAPASAPAAAPAPAAEFDEDALEEAYGAALMEGDTRKAAAIRRSINAHVREQAAADARREVEQQRQQDQQRATADALAAESQATLQAFPYLNTEEGKEALLLIVEARDGKIARGMAPLDALRAAVKAIAPKFAPAGQGDTPSKDLPHGEPKTDLRQAAAVERGAKASMAQPAVLTGGVGERAEAGRINVAQLTDEQFEKLPDAEKRRLRGD